VSAPAAALTRDYSLTGESPVRPPVRYTFVRHRTADSTYAPVKTPVHDDSRGHDTVTYQRAGDNTGEYTGAAVKAPLHDDSRSQDTVIRLRASLERIRLHAEAYMCGTRCLKRS